MERFTLLAEKYRIPVIIATEHMFASAEQEVKINYELGLRRLKCCRMPHEAAAVFRALASYSEYLQQKCRDGWK